MKSAKHFQDMAPDTKVPDERKDGQRQNNIPPPMAGDNKQTWMQIPCVLVIKRVSNHCNIRM
ncbi:hypothetical protein DPMN_122173 [Dreissena polymorpha]|uniref:Uncharacterized protein n=1 Tax=Dreissena polymorpha TaxID=45954 RepID=A0A9D4GUZ6_DREPO|nr:hypothetical protein DPMN_122173 [Dreissena polymorpha]